jgi:conjugal transfer pilin signal peptidase TrbI
MAPDKTMSVGGENVGAFIKTTSSGHELRPLKFSGPLPKGYVFVASPHERSFDSRYEEMGLLNLKDLKGRAIPLF